MKKIINITKRCTICEETKNLDQFSRRKASLDGYQPSCKKCQTDTFKKWYQENHKKIRKKALDKYYDNWKTLQEKRILRRKTIGAARREWLNNIKKTLSCIICGENRYYCLVFHHRNPSQKDETLSRMLGQLASIKRMQKEIEKCDVLCYNCHAEIHHNDKSVFAKNRPIPNKNYPVKIKSPKLPSLEH